MPDIHGENKVVKKKLWDKVKDGFNSNAEGNVNWFGSDLIGQRKRQSAVVEIVELVKETERRA